jgi:hypothetical protein
MKLTILHIFIIILVALVLCSTLGGNCGGKEGYQNNESYQNKQYRRYGGREGYYKHLDRENTQGGTDGSDLNGGDSSDPSGMYSESHKRSHHRHKYNDYNKAYRRERQNNMFGPVSTGSMNASMFNSANDYSVTENYEKHHGIKRHQIPEGQEDLYILKTQTVPPICPACPKCPSVNCDDKCPPCPACARCPEPQFECKKVPNYSGGSLMGHLPLPWMDKLDIN